MFILIIAFIALCVGLEAKSNMLYVFFVLNLSFLILRCVSIFHQSIVFYYFRNL